MIMKWKEKKDVCLISTTHDEKMAPARVCGQDMDKPKAVIDHNPRMGGVDHSDAYSTSYRSTRETLKKILSKALLSFD
jgi:hypothetical protein